MRRSITLLALLAAGCAGASRGTRNFRPEVQAPPEAWQGVARIAVVPPDNWTTDFDLDYIAWFRAVINTMLRERGYQTPPLAVINRFMLKNHFMLGGELGQYSPAQLCQEFGTDAILYWDIVGKDTLNLNLVKADKTPLWGSGEVKLTTTYRYYFKESGPATDKLLALAITETLRKLPAKP